MSLRGYTSEAIKATNKEFSRRKLDERTLNRIVAAAETVLEEKYGRREGSEPRPKSDAKETAKLGLPSDSLLCRVCDLRRV